MYPFNVYYCVCIIVYVYFVVCVFWFFLCSFFPSVLWYCWLGLLTCKNRLRHNLYCVGGDVKHYSVQSNPIQYFLVQQENTSIITSFLDGKGLSQWCKCWGHQSPVHISQEAMCPLAQLVVGSIHYKPMTGPECEWSQRQLMCGARRWQAMLLWCKSI